MSRESEFESQVLSNIERMGKDLDLQGLSRIWIREIIPYKYAYNFKWLGQPIMQTPQDIVAWQELIWQIKPDLIIETGIAHGGSLILSASMLAMLDMEDALYHAIPFDPRKSHRTVLGIDIDIREHNRIAIEKHPLAGRIHMIQGSSTDKEIVDQVYTIAKEHSKIMICLDSNHTHEHVLAELEAYAPLVSVGSYCVVFDTGIEDLPEHLCADRPWGKGNNPKTAVWEFLQHHDGFEIDKEIEWKLLIHSAPDGWLKRVK